MKVELDEIKKSYLEGQDSSVEEPKTASLNIVLREMSQLIDNYDPENINEKEFNEVSKLFEQVGPSQVEIHPLYQQLRKKFEELAQK